MSTTQAPTLDGTPKVEVLGRLPVFESPFTRLTEHWFTWQGGPCADAELDFMMCASRVGTKRAEAECKKYHDDFIECAYRIKTLTRYKSMQEERKRQGKAFVEPPPPDSIRVWKKQM